MPERPQPAPPTRKATYTYILYFVVAAVSFLNVVLNKRDGEVDRAMLWGGVGVIWLVLGIRKRQRRR
jgi:hypothetical protein